VRSVDLAVYADALGGEYAAIAARAERVRSRLREAAIEREARTELAAETIDALQGLGLLRAVDERAARAELRELEHSLEALAELQAWVERRLAA
jgi:hypothetical protein